ncbi:aldolase [Leifsonia bigeumensis]|uniref:Aldolase n=1 Tax=Leifsonella bigeumensis TaxID=433643 RepID=A0ABP7FI92_9MICO
MTDLVNRAMNRVVEVSRYVHERGLTHGSTGNLSVRLGDEIVVTPTGKSLRTLEVVDLAIIGLNGEARSSAKASKEAVLHAAVFRARPGATAVIHTHSRFSTAVSCLRDIDESDALPPLTAYYAMRVGKLPVVPYFPPGDPELAVRAGLVAEGSHAMLLRNHGPLVAGRDLDHALDVLEELEQTAELSLLLEGRRTSPLEPDAARRLHPTDN